MGLWGSKSGRKGKQYWVYKEEGLGLWGSEGDREAGLGLKASELGIRGNQEWGV